MIFKIKSGRAKYYTASHGVMQWILQHDDYYMTKYYETLQGDEYNHGMEALHFKMTKYYKEMVIELIWKTKQL